MKTNKVGLIPISTLRHTALGLRTAALCALLALFLTPGAFGAGPDEWPDMGFYTPDDLVEPISNGMSLASASALACRPFLQISLSHEGAAQVTPTMMLHVLNFPEHMYSVDIVGPLDDSVFCDQIGETLMATVREIPTGNTCMSQFTVEDKLPPMLTCIDDTIPCYSVISELDFLSFIDAVSDNCTPFEDLDLTYSYTITDLDCHPSNMSARIDVMYSATDLSGNNNVCTKSIYLEKFPLDSVEFPADTMISCLDPDYGVENVGEPTINGVPVDHHCELVSWKTDVVIPLCTGEFKVARLWKVMDWCTGVTRVMMQSILVIDTIPPEIDCPVDDTISTDDSKCFATYTFPDPVVTDVCSDDSLIVTLFQVSGFPGYFHPGDQVVLPVGDYVVTVTATDDCLSTGTCEYNITVIDDELPVLVCHDYSTNLNDWGFSVLQAASAQFWASDNCGIDSISVRKLYDVCGNPQDTIFGEEVTFCCAEAGTFVMVEFKAIDVYGNESLCWILVEVKDATPPVALCKNICVYLDDTGNVTITPASIDSGSYDNCGIESIVIDKDAFVCSDLDPMVNPHTVRMIVTDSFGLMDTCYSIVTVKDTIPPVARCKDITVQLDTATKLAVITWSDVNDGSTDNCVIDSASVKRDTFGCADVGDTIVVELLVVDWSGNRDSCTAKVVVIDNPPVVTCMDVTLALDSMGMVVVKQSDIDEAMDDCGIDTVIINPDTLTCLDTGVNVVTLTVIDNHGNMASCESQVTVIDTIAPICNPKDITVQLDQNGMATIDSNAVDSMSYDECGLILIEVVPDTFTCADILVPVVVVQTVTDANGNTSTCTATVTVENNNPPECNTTDITVYVDENGMVTIDSNAVDSMSTSACGLDSISVEPNMFACDNIDSNLVVQTVTDIHGDTSTCTAYVTVLDTLAPICLTMDIEVFLDADGIASITDNSVDSMSSDNCEVMSITVTPKDFTCDSVGTVIVTQTVTDVNMNSSMCTAIVTVIDNVPPECMTMDITVNLDSNGMATIDSNAVDNGSSDACGIAHIMLSQDTFTCLDGDSVIVTMTVTDVNNNMSTCTAIVYITNTGGPVAVCNDTTIYLNDFGVVSITPEDVDGGSSANCDSVTLEIDVMDFMCSDTGANSVILTVKDISGDSAICEAIVTVLDTISPVCLAKNDTVYLDGLGNASIVIGDVDNGSNDVCGVDLSIDPFEFTCADTGIVMVTITATDPSLNVSTCVSMVTVADTIAPMCYAFDSIFIVLPANGMVSITPADVDSASTDNCGIESLEIDKSMFECADIGVDTVTLTVTDFSGNSSTCQTIVIVEDGANFECNTMNITVSLGDNGMVVIEPEDIDDMDNPSGGGCGSENLMLSLDSTMFDCDDIGDVIVTLTVTTDSDSSSCTAIVTVEDNTPPVITCPPDMTVDCGTPLNDPSFGTATATDNCDVTIDTVETGDFDDCGAGTLTRTFTATDGFNTSECVQVITFGSDPFVEGDIEWPPLQYDLPECSSTHPDSILGSQPTVELPDGNCAQISITFTDMTVLTCDTIPSTPCKVVTRTWTVFDSCDDGNEMFTREQIISVFDSTGPVFTPIADITVLADTGICTAEVALVATAMDCGVDAVSITNDFNAGGADASGIYPFGTTTVVFTAEDSCCNTSTLTVNVIVEDPGEPAWECVKPIICIPPSGDTTFFAIQFVTFENPDGCTDSTDYLYSFTPFDPFDNDTLVDCGDENSVLSLQIWIWTMDLVNVATCTGDLEIQGGDDCTPDNCPTANLTVSGTVYNEAALNINQVPVVISDAGMNPTETDGDGYYEFGGLSFMNDYALGPYDNTGPLEGVSTLDLVEIQKHLLGLKDLDSPYKRIAADADGNGKLTVLDMLELRKLLLGTISEFSNNTSWRFVDAHFDFPDPYNPFMTQFPEDMIIDELEASMSDVDFVGVKIGDVNNTFTNLDDPVIEVKSPMDLVLTIQEQYFKAGEYIQLPIYAANFEGLAGFQFGLSYDQELVEYVGMEIPATSVMDETNFGLSKADEGSVLVSWSTGVGVSRDVEEVLFTLQFRAKSSGSASSLLNISNEALIPQAYVDGDQISINSVDIFTVDSEQLTTGEEFSLLQNRPNPFTDQTEIPFFIPEDGEVELLVHSADGQLVYSTKQSVLRGLQTITLDHEDLNAIGIYYYTIINDKYRATRKLTVLD